MRLVMPDKRKPLLHWYIAVPPTVVEVTMTDPPLGAGRFPQSTAVGMMARVMACQLSFHPGQPTLACGCQSRPLSVALALTLTCPYQFESKVAGIHGSASHQSGRNFNGASIRSSKSSTVHSCFKPKDVISIW